MQVRCLVRRPGARTVVDLHHPQIEIVQGDLLDEASLVAAVQGVDAVVHAATDTKFTNRQAAWDVAVEGTRRLYQAASQARVKRFLFVSTLTVYMGAGQANEDQPLSPCGDLYADTKIAAERLLLDAVDGPEAVILRPPSIYGPGSEAWSASLMRQARSNRLYLPAGGRFRMPLVYIDNFVDAVMAALAATQAGGAYNILDGAPTYREFVAPFAAAAGVRPKHLPYPVLWLAAAMADLYSKLSGKYIPFGRRTLSSMLNVAWDPTLSYTGKAERLLGWRPRIGFAEGMAQTLAWLREQGL